jgi:hypothetical protein
MNAVVDRFIAEGPTRTKCAAPRPPTWPARSAGWSRSGGFGGKAVTLASGEVLANDPDFYARQLEILANLTPADVRSAMQRWLRRPALTIQLEPGAREGAYEEAASTKAAARSGSDKVTVSKVRRSRPSRLSRRWTSGCRARHAQQRNACHLRSAECRAEHACQPRLQCRSAADPVAKRGLEELTLNLMDEGTTTMSSQQLAEAQERLGASIGTGGGVDRSAFTLDALTPTLRRHWNSRRCGAQSRLRSG